jgi:hypothetical protein
MTAATVGLLVAASHAQVKPRPPYPPLPEMSLREWRFNEPTAFGDARHPPAAAENVAFAPSWSGFSLLMAGEKPALLQYAEMDAAGNTNICLAVVGHTVVAIKKPEIYQGSFVTSRLEVLGDVGGWTIQPAVNFDPVPTNGFAWFVAKGPPLLTNIYQGQLTNTYQAEGGAIRYLRLRWNGTNAAWVDTNWVSLSESSYRDYYDLDGTNTTTIPSSYTGVSAPQPEDTNNIKRVDLHVLGSRLMMAVIRDGFLWTCHHIGLSGTNESYAHMPVSTNVDRSAVQWIKLQIVSNSTALAFTEAGRMRDKMKTENPSWYFFPSLMVNQAGDMAVGFSGSSATNYISAYYTWRLADGTTPDAPTLLHSGLNSYSGERWGDYSYTCLDPSDRTTFWTVQEYAQVYDGVVPNWATRIGRLKRRP